MHEYMLGENLKENFHLAWSVGKSLCSVYNNHNNNIVHREVKTQNVFSCNLLRDFTTQCFPLTKCTVSLVCVLFRRVTRRGGDTEKTFHDELVHVTRKRWTKVK